MTPRRLVAALAALALIGLILFLTRGRGDAGASSGDTQGQTQGEATAAGQPARKTSSAPQAGTPQSPDSAKVANAGKVYVQGGWGSGPNDFGRHNVPESNPEGPLTISVDNKGNAFILDQVNGRILRFDKDGKPLPSFQLTQQAPRDIVVSPTGTTLVMDQLRDKTVAVLDTDGKLIGELPVTGKRLNDKENGLATGVFADADGVYVEKGHAMQFRVGDAAGNPDPDQPLMDGRPSREGGLLLSMGLIKASAGRFWVRATDRATGQMKFMREFTLPMPIMQLMFLDSDSSGRLYAAAHVGRELPINPADGGHGGGFTDESVQLLCLSPTGEPRNTLTLPANTMPEESVRDLAVRDDGTILYMYRTPAGLQVYQYTCG